MPNGIGEFVLSTKRHAKLHTIVGMEAPRDGKNRARQKSDLQKPVSSRAASKNSVVIKPASRKNRCRQTPVPQKSVTSNLVTAKIGVVKVGNAKTCRYQDSQLTVRLLVSNLLNGSLTGIGFRLTGGYQNAHKLLGGRLLWGNLLGGNLLVSRLILIGRRGWCGVALAEKVAEKFFYGDNFSFRGVRPTVYCRAWRTRSTTKCLAE